MHAGIGGVREPVVRLGAEIRIAEKVAAVEQIAAHAANRPLDFAFGLRAIGPAGPDPKAPVRGKAQELGILEELAAVGAPVLDDGLSPRGFAMRLAGFLASD